MIGSYIEVLKALVDAPEPLVKAAKEGMAEGFKMVSEVSPLYGVIMDHMVKSLPEGKAPVFQCEDGSTITLSESVEQIIQAVAKIDVDQLFDDILDMAKAMLAKEEEDSAEA